VRAAVKHLLAGAASALTLVGVVLLLVPLCLIFVAEEIYDRADDIAEFRWW
jgi:hypothetical protein